MDTARYDVARVCRAYAVARGEPVNAAAYARAHYGPGAVLRILEKAASGVLDSGAISDDPDFTTAGAAFVAWILKPVSLISQIDAASPFFRAPFLVKTLAQDAGSTGYWTAEGAKIKTSAAGFDIFSLPPTKCAALTLATDEAVRRLDPGADAALSRDLARAVALEEGRAFVDPSNQGGPDKPASVTAGVPPIASSGTDPASIQADIAAMLAAYEGNLQTSVWLMPPSMCVALAGLGMAAGALSLVIGSSYFQGLPVVTHPGVPDGTLILCDPSAIALSDPRVVVADSSAQATIEVEDVDSNTTLYSTWQQNMVALRCLEYIHWRVMRPGCVSVLTGLIFTPASTGKTAARRAIGA
ncbi:phage major capsid protein [Paraburkholderia sp. J7]|uniref:phage major capsid protein n=1 Tax=Paraburkholderia sp. J7 TaxID=2805438 RepID=UPI002AB6B10E|nr:phage major capsid protein [Paraburkholderia sp. J7]